MPSESVCKFFVKPKDNSVPTWAQTKAKKDYSNFSVTVLETKGVATYFCRDKRSLPIELFASGTFRLF